MGLLILFAGVLVVNVVAHRWGVDSRDGNDWTDHHADHDALERCGTGMACGFHD